MPRKKRQIPMQDIQEAILGLRNQYGLIVTTQQLADILCVSQSTLYDWVGKGRFDGTFRKRGKHMRFWLSRALDEFFNGNEWRDEE